MTCSSVDLKAYVLGEEPAEHAVTAHVAACESCREELERLRATRTALLALPQEEMPRRIAFVSDKIFEPRWWQRIWHSGPAMGFASAALLAVAILLHGYARPIPTAAPGVDASKLEARVEAEVARRVDVAVNRAVSESEARQNKETARLLDAAEKRFAAQRQSDLVDVKEAMAYYEKALNRWTVAYNDAALKTGGAQ